MPTASEQRPDPGPPLWSIGLVVLLMLGVPIILYSLAPSGPLREGDTIFSAGASKVPFLQPSLYDRDHYDGTCLLDPQDPLIVLQRPSHPEGSVLARVQGKTNNEWPFCPPQAEVILASHHIAQKPDPLAELKKRWRERWNR